MNYIAAFLLIVTTSLIVHEYPFQAQNAQKIWANI